MSYKFTYLDKEGDLCTHTQTHTLNLNARRRHNHCNCVCLGLENDTKLSALWDNRCGAPEAYLGHIADTILLRQIVYRSSFPKMRYYQRNDHHHRRLNCIFFLHTPAPDGSVSQNAQLPPFGSDALEGLPIPSSARARGATITCASIPVIRDRERGESTRRRAEIRYRLKMRCRSKEKKINSKHIMLNANSMYPNHIRWKLH